MNSTDTLIKNGKEVNLADAKTFAKRLHALEYTERMDALEEIFKHHYEKGNYDVFDTIRDELRVLDGRNAPNLSKLPKQPRGWWGNSVLRPDGDYSIIIEDIIYTQKPKSGSWTLKGGNKKKKQTRKTRKRKTRRYR